MDVVAPPAPPVAPATSPWRRTAPSLTLGAVAACGCVALAVANPGDDGTPLCWSRAVFGFDCPFCGGLRCANSLLRGDVAAALDHNVLLAVALPVTALMWVVWTVRAWRGDDVRKVKVPAWLWGVTVLLLVAFTVVRNLGGPAWARWLHSDTFAS